MTTPRGYPDYQNYPQWRGTVINASTLNINSASAFTKSFYVAQFTALQCFIVSNTGAVGANITFQWFTDSTMATPQGNYAASVFQLGTFCATIPNLGNFCLVTVSTPNATNISMTINIQPVNIPVAKPQYQVVNNRIISHNQSIPANGTVQFYLPFVCEGTGYVLVESATAGISYNVFVEPLDAGGNALGELYIGNAIVVITSAFFQSGPQTVRFTVTNNNAAAQTFNFTCSLLPA